MDQVASDTVRQTHVGNCDDAEYQAFLSRIQKRFEANTIRADGTTRPLFLTSHNDWSLWEMWLLQFAAEQRQFHNCNMCRHFVQRFGSLVVIGDDGVVESALWHEDDAPTLYRPSVKMLNRHVRAAKVHGVFHISWPEWGQGATGVWRHMSIQPAEIGRASCRERV